MESIADNKALIALLISAGVNPSTLTVTAPKVTVMPEAEELGPPLLVSSLAVEADKRALTALLISVKVRPSTLTVTAPNVTVMHGGTVRGPPLVATDSLGVGFWEVVDLAADLGATGLEAVFSGASGMVASCLEAAVGMMAVGLGAAEVFGAEVVGLEDMGLIWVAYFLGLFLGGC